MDDKWYYVQKGNRHGPVPMATIESMLKGLELSPDDFVWKKGFENWKKIREVSELSTALEAKAPELPEEEPTPEAPKAEIKAAIPAAEKKAAVKLKDLDQEHKSIYIRTGNDRGETATDYGPFNLLELKQLFKDKRINGKTFIFSPGNMKEWMILADVADYQEVFQEMPPVILEADRRSATRKPFVARLFVQNNKKVYEGICRDISIGGIQVLMKDFLVNAGDKITINVHPENSDYHFVASGQVVRLLEGHSGFSFRFLDLNDEARQSIEKYLQDS